MHCDPLKRKIQPGRLAPGTSLGDPEELHQRLDRSHGFLDLRRLGFGSRLHNQRFAGCRRRAAR